jgi:hypothetical protein
MGLLDGVLPNLLSDDPQKREAQKMGLLNFGAQMLANSQRGFSPALGYGIAGGTQTYQGQLEQQQKSALQAMQAKKYGMDMQLAQAELERPGKIASVLNQPPRATGMPQQGAPVQNMSASDRYLSQAQALEEAGYLKEAQDYYSLADKFRPKIKEQKNLRDAQGNVVTVNVYDDGRTERVDGFAPAEKLHFSNTGGATVGMDQYTGLPIASIKNTQSPDSIASNATTIRGQNMVDARGREANDLKRQELGAGGKAPAGYRWKPDGTLEAVKGGPGDKLPESQQKQVVGTQNLSNAIAEYRAQLSNFGLLDSVSPDARAMMGTKYNNMMLQAKEAYNLGVLNGPDFEILQSVITDPRSLKGAFTSKKALDNQASELDRIMQGVAGVSSKPRPQAAASNSKPSNTPKAGAVMEGYRFKGGDPANKANWEKA